MSANKIKAIFFDVDGTLLDFKTHRIPESAKLALELAAEHGVLLFIATGRHKSEVNFASWAPGVDISGFVTLNGQYCYTDERVIYKKPINPRDIAAIVDVLSREPFPCMFIEEHDVYFNMIDDQVREAFASIEMPLPRVESPVRALERDVFQLCVFGGDDEPPCMSYVEHCDCTRWGGWAWDVVSRGGNKWEGILRMIEPFGIGPDETAAVGDSHNDVEMLKNAGFSVAMGNADTEIKKHASFVTDDIDKDGILKAVKHILAL